ncbi:MAG: DinB family protein [Candidatus Limnocylindria bacterium]|nr:DinB family protein [Candidatus Limnocylindria bacterium]
MDRDDRAFSLMDDAATISAIVRRTPAARLAEIAFADWTWLDLIGHVADTAELFAERVRRCIEEDDPSFPDRDTDAWVSERRGSRDAAECAARISAEHMRLVRLLDAPGAPARTATHSTHGRVTAGQVADYQVRHSREHVRELQAAFPPG